MEERALDTAYGRLERDAEAVEEPEGAEAVEEPEGAGQRSRWTRRLTPYAIDGWTRSERADTKTLVDEKARPRAGTFYLRGRRSVTEGVDVGRAL